MSAALEASGPLSRRQRYGWCGAWLLLYGIHLTLVFQFMPLDELISVRPIHEIDHSLHYYQVDRASKAFAESGKLWGWDPQQLAGYPSGTVEDMSSKTLELFVIGLERLGLPRAVSFNLYLLLAQLLLPLLALCSGWLFRLERIPRYVLGLLWILLWHFDSFIHWCWHCGMISWAIGSAFAVVAVGVVYRVFEQFKADSLRWRWILGGLAVSAAGTLLHPLIAIMVAIPAAALYLRSFRLPGIRQHLFVGGAIAAASCAAMVWLLPALPVWHYVVKSEFFLRPGPHYLLFDLLELQMSASATGPPVQTMVRFVCLVAGLILLWRWRKARDRRTLPISVMVVMGIAVAYLGRYVFVTSTAQPYRFITAAIFASAIPAAILLTELFARERLKSLSPTAVITLLICALLLVPRTVRTFLYFFPDVAPFMLFERRLPAPRHPINRVLGGRTFKMKNSGAPTRFRDVRRWLLKHHRGGRVLVQGYELGEYLAATTDLPIIGGFAFRPMHHADAYLFQYEAKISRSRSEIARYFDRYAITTVVMHKIHWGLENDRNLMTFRTSIDGLHFRIFSTKADPGYVLRGEAKVTAQAFNRIVVEEARGKEVILKFHYFEPLRCKPNCKVERFSVPHDRVGFIRIKNPPPRFEIYNSYQYPPSR